MTAAIPPPRMSFQSDTRPSIDLPSLRTRASGRSNHSRLAPTGRMDSPSVRLYLSRVSETVRVGGVSTAMNSEASPPPARMFSARWWTAGQGWSGIAQWPNPAIAVWLIAVVVGWTGALDTSRSSTLAGVGNGALLVWALDELVRGDSPIRRLLGAVVLAAQLVHLFA